MSESGDRDRSGRRRRRRGGRKELEVREKSDTPTVTKPPTILTKPHTDRNDRTPDDSPMASPGAGSRGTESKPIIMLKSREPRDESRQMSPAGRNQNIPGIPVRDLPSETPPSTPSYHLQSRGSLSNAPSEAHSTAVNPTVLGTSSDKGKSMKLVDEAFQWSEFAMETLLDNSNFLVIGFVGLQGSGKSTIASLLAGATVTSSSRFYPFKPQSQEVREVCAHQTIGIDIYVTDERVIFLDSQAMLSASVLDHMIHRDKKYPTEFTCAENCVEMQSLQLLTFMLTVCNAVLVVQDWFTDTNLLRLIQTAEMLKPPTPSPSHEGSSVQDDAPEYYPYIGFILNKACREDFSVENYRVMQRTISTVFSQSKLKYKGPITMANGNLMPGLSNETIDTDVNMFLLPTMSEDTDKEGILTLLPEYRGYPSFEFLVKSLRKQIYALPRHLLTHTTLSEKNWFHYAARTWDAVKKSSLVSDYNRLLP